MELLSSAINAISNYASNLKELQSPAITDEMLTGSLRSLCELCSKSCHYFTRNRKIVLYDGCLSNLYILLNQDNLKLVCLEALLETLISLTKSSG